MTGTIKFYDSSKGFGFIYTNEQAEDIYFHINNWDNASVPNGNDDVEFEVEKSSKGFQAKKIKLVKSADEKNAERKQKSDDRVVCPSCNRRIIPRVVFREGSPDYSMCSFCGATIKEFPRSFCFIATAVYGDVQHKNLVTLRDFRDSILLKNDIGTRFVNFYYAKSPRIANYIKDKIFIKTPLRILLNTFVFIYKIFKK